MALFDMRRTDPLSGQPERKMNCGLAIEGNGCFSISVADLGYLSLDQQTSNLFYQVISTRHSQRRSSIITTNRLCGAPHNVFWTKPLRGIR